ncbi:hypothetical protein B0A49_04026 [Cryomyces minteri]|uniref:AP complex mu/sigma subunit domain-containing protein n=1 Tax=Cryomyces minteri TaxID=331657 RepID=A0A4U0X241_9PEZI|nr:hypothetical protein B0A49_04026 [Cryomyces minteri]
MINAVLVFNNNGQPRLTKFYTQLVQDDPVLGYICPATPNLGDLHARCQPSKQLLQLPTTAASSGLLFDEGTREDRESTHSVHLPPPTRPPSVASHADDETDEKKRIDSGAPRHDPREQSATQRTDPSPVLPTEAVSRWLDRIPVAPSMEVTLRGGAGRRGSFPFFDYRPQRILDALAWPFRQCLYILEVDGYANTALPKHQYPPSQANGQHWRIVPSLVTYRHYATLYFIVISTSTESPLALLDLIQVFVESLDRLFQDVCELDLNFNFETLHAVLGEMIVGGVVIETGLERVVEGVKSQGRVAKRPVNEGRGTGGLGSGVWAGRNINTVNSYNLMRVVRKLWMIKGQRDAEERAKRAAEKAAEEREAQRLAKSKTIRHRAREWWTTRKEKKRTKKAKNSVARVREQSQETQDSKTQLVVVEETPEDEDSGDVKQSGKDEGTREDRESTHSVYLPPPTRPPSVASHADDETDEKKRIDSGAPRHDPREQSATQRTDPSPVLPTEAVSRWLDRIPVAPSMEVTLRGGAGRRGSFPFFDYRPQRILDALAWPFRQCLCILEVDGYANTALPKHQYPPSQANGQHWRIVDWQPQSYQLDYTPGPSLRKGLENSLPQYAQHDPRPTPETSHVVQDPAQPLSGQGIGTSETTPPGHASRQGSDATLVESSVDSERQDLDTRARMMNYELRHVLERRTQILEDYQRHDLHAAAGGETGPPEDDTTVESSDRAVPDQAIVAEVQATSGPDPHIIEETQAATRASQIVSAEDSAITTEGRLQAVATVEVNPTAAQIESSTQHSENTAAGESEPATAQGGRITMDTETPHVADSRAATTIDSQPFTVYPCSRHRGIGQLHR